MAVEIPELTAVPLAATATVDKQTEENIHKLCAEVLSRPLAKVKLGRSFLAHGGDSLLAIKLMARCQSIGYTINVQDLLQATSIREFCRYVQPQDRDDGPASHLPNGITGSNGATLSNGHAGPTGTARALLDDADTGSHPTPTDLPRSVDQPLSQAEDKGSRHADEEVPPFSLWQEGRRALADDGNLSSTTMDEQLRLVAEQCGVSVDMIEDVYPCTPLQESLMAVTAKQPRAYVNRWVYRMPRDLDTARFRKAWVLVARAAPLLRTRLVLGPLGTALQVVVREDLRWCSGTNLDQYIAEDDECLMGYGSPLVRLAIAGNPDLEDGHYVVFTAHHSAYDGWSWAKVLEIAVRTYHQRDDSIPISPPFTRFIRYLGERDEAEAASFWQSQLGGQSAIPFPVRSMPSYNPNPSQIITHEVTATPAVAGITMAGLLRAAWALVISSHTRDDDVVFASVLSGRTVPVKDVSDMLAPTVTTVPVRIRIDKAQPVAEYLAAIQQQAISMMPFEHTGLQSIYQHIGTRLDMGHIFTVQPADVWASVTTAPPLGLEVHTAPDTRADGYGLAVECLTGGSTDTSAVQVRVRFDETMVSKALLGRLLARFAHTLADLTRILHNDGVVGDLDMLCPSDIEKLLQWNPDLPLTANQDCLHERIHQQCLARQDAQAVCAWDGELSYTELDALSDRLARHLDGLGIREETMVGLCFEKSMWTIVAMLAVLKAGGVIVPLGTQLPPQRLSFLLENTKAPVVLTSEECATKVEHVETPHKCIVNAAFFATLPETSGSPDRPSLTPEHTAVVIYTSGSTGLPKGVVLTHGGFCASLGAHGAALGHDPSTRTLQHSAYVFDASLFDIFGTLWFGGCVCVVSEENRMDPNKLARAARDLGANFMLLTPTVANILDPAAIPSLRTLALGGEALQPATVEMWLGHVSLFNCYGPTECSIMCTINGPLTDENRSCNIGRPLAASMWVADEEDYNRLVPVGAVGELLVEGPLLAREYLHDPQRTAAAFITDPDFVFRHGFAKPRWRTHRRMYRTGDLVRQSPVDGSLTYVGRRDGQAKIRGQRLEVGEIEYWAKRAFDQARTVVAGLISPAVRNGDPILAVALEVPCQDALDDMSPFLPLTDALRRSLSTLQDALVRALPSFMVPKLYVPMQQMPLMTSGKVDRGQLKNLLNSLGEHQLSQYALICESCSFTRPLTDSESRLRDLWASVLSTNAAVGPASNFFRLGGDSVTAMRLVAMAVKAKPPIYLSVSDVFGNPVLENMAKTVASKPADSTSLQEVNDAAELDATPFSLMPTSSDAQNTLVRLATRCGVTADAIEDAYPCTPLQEGLLALTAREQSAYVGCWVFRMSDGLDADRFRGAWEKISEVAVMLRTRIVASDDAQVSTQVVVREPLPWGTVSSDLETYLSQDEPDPMGVGRPLMRFTVVSTPQSSRFFVWKAHHSVYDGYSCDKILQAVRDVYSEQATTAFVPYTRFIKYLRRANAQSEAEEYWRSQLKGDLGSGFPAVPPNHQLRSSSTISLHIAPASTSSTLTTATLLRAAWALVLSQETGSRDVVFAATLSGRMAPVPGILDMAAPTLATVPVRVSTGLDRSVGDYLAAVQQQAATMIPFEHVGLQNIKQMLPGKTLDLNHLFVIQPSADRIGQDSASLLPQGLEPVPYSALETFHRYPLVVECNTGAEAQDGIHGISLEARFDEVVLPSDKARAVMERFRHVFVQLRAAASASSEDSIPLRHVELLGPQDLSRIRGWNRWSRAADPRSDKCIHDLVHLQSLARPNAQAVCAWDGQLTYAELDSLSLRLAHHLVGLGVCREAPVLMIFEKSLWAVVAHLAILRAGGVVVPVGHKHPVQRVQDIIQASGARLILSSKEYESHRGLAPHILAVDEHLMGGLPSGQQGPACEGTNSTNAAFVIFTSGSTGVPKGVVLEHHTLVTSLKAQLDRFMGSIAPRALQFSSYTFDISIAETFMPLITGGCVCVPSEEDRVSNLATAMETMRVDLAYLTPTVASFLQPETLPSLRTLVLIGEALKSEVVAGWVAGGVQTWNGYGPAECSVLCTASRVSDASEAPSIGTALAGSNLWVVDPLDHHCLVPVGIPGELLLEGPLLARGYMGDDDKTAAAFVTDPAWLGCFDFGPRQGRRFYRTGDLVQQAPDGSLIYLGRRDTQVKLHGQRLEIGEIEHWVKKVLGAQAGAAVVGLLAREDDTTSAGEPVLAVAVAINHAESGAEPEPAQNGEGPFSLLPLCDGQRQLFSRLRASLSEVLPSFMVPHLYIPVDKLPTLDSGKLDRRTVWATIQQSRRSSHYSVATNRTRVAPDSDTERQLQQLWAAVLRIPLQEIGASDDFFLSGGDSISAMRLVARAREATRMPLTVADISQNPVLADLAKVLDARRSENALPQSSYQAFSAMGVAETGPYIAEFIQPLLLEGSHVVDVAPVTDSQGLSAVVSLRESRDYLLYITLAGEGPCEVEKWKASCWELVRRHEALRTAYLFVKEQMLQIVLQEWQPAIAHYETDDATTDGFTKDLIARDLNRPRCLGQPFVEFAIVTSPSQHRILIRICHSDYDATSVPHYFNDLSAIHAGKAKAAEPSSFIRDYVAPLTGNPAALQQSRLYWRGLLQGASMPRIAPPHQRAPSKLIFHPARTIPLPGLGSRSGNRITAATLMMATWGLTLARYTGQADVTFGEAVSGRSTGQPAAAHATGCCTNIVPARIVVRADASVRDLLDAAQAQRAARLPHETFGFRELLGNRGKMEAEEPHFTTRINHLDRPLQELRVGDVYQTTVELYEGAHDIVDISLTSFSTPDYIGMDFRYREGAISAEGAEQFLSCLCAVAELLADPSSEAMRLGELELGPHGDTWPAVEYGSVALGIGQPEEEAGCGV